MPSSLRAASVVAGAALLVSVTVAAAAPVGAKSTAEFAVSPSFAPVAATVHLHGADFTGETGVTFNGVPATQVTQDDARHLTVVVPDGATTGEVDVQQGVTTLTGPIFTVQQATHSTSSASKSTLTYSHKLLVKARETVAANGDPVRHQPAALQHRSGPEHAWKHAKGISAKRTGKAGRVQWRVKPHANGQYRVYFRNSHDYLGRATNAHRVRVLPRIHLRSLHTVSQFDSATIRGSVHPLLSGPVYLQRFESGKWHRVRHTFAHGGHFAFPLSPSSIGHLRYRVVRHHDSSHGVGTSHPLNLQVVRRTLHLGASGKDVLALQKRLHHLHYDIGPRNGSYGYDTLHAVTAFQKVNGLSKDGSAGPQVWSKLNHPKRIHLRYPYRNDKLAVEVNIAKQVVIMSRYGKVWRILDTSTGGGYTYTGSDGTTQRAVTPRGHFSIQYKLSGWHKSKLGEMYYPSYFTNTGYAIHGEGNGNSGSEVPPYPNSHGCVRISNNAVLRYFNRLVVGTSVWVYG